MMTERQQQLDKRIEGVRSGDILDLGPVDEIETPLSVNLSQRSFVLDRAGGEWVVYPERCPHQLGPLELSDDGNAQVRCAWHGYRFDLQTGECLTGSACRLGDRPTVRVDQGQLSLHW